MNSTWKVENWCSKTRHWVVIAGPFAWIRRESPLVLARTLWLGGGQSSPHAGVSGIPMAEGRIKHLFCLFVCFCKARHKSRTRLFYYRPDVTSIVSEVTVLEIEWIQSNNKNKNNKASVNFDSLYKYHSKHSKKLCFVMYLLTPAQCFITLRFYYINRKRNFNQKTPLFL